MELRDDKAKKIPLLIIGPAPAALSSTFACISLAEKFFPAEPDVYFLVCAETEVDLRGALESLAQAGVPADQILLAQTEQKTFRVSPDPRMGVLEITAADKPEEIRQRLFARLETQRHRKLAHEIERARTLGIPSELKAEEWSIRLEAAHLTHGFCYAMELPASRHARAIRLALTGEASACWSACQGPEELLPLCARLALVHHKNPAAFREEFRKLSAPLPFRIRTDLRNTMERCLEIVWKGAENVA